MNSAIETGTGEGFLARVTSTGNLQTEVGNTVTVERADVTVYRAFVNAGTTSGTLLGARTGRQSLWIQNQGAFPCYLRFANAAATNQDWLVAAGGEFRAEDFRYADIITVITVGGNSNILALEMAP